jgi:acid phosphatase
MSELKCGWMSQWRRCAFNSWIFAFALALVAIMPAGIAAAAECPSKPYRQALSPTRPLNLGELKRQLLNYKCFGAYDRDVALVLAGARRYVEMRAPRVKKPALVLDIDETALTNWRQILANDFGYIIEGACDLRPNFPCGVQTWEKSAQAEAIKPTLELFNAATRKGVAVFFISGRPEEEQERLATETNLRRAGYDGWAGLIMRPRDAAGAVSVADYKASERRKIEQLGYRIIANVGDQLSDLRGGRAERRFRVPNPFYFIP